MTAQVICVQGKKFRAQCFECDYQGEIYYNAGVAMDEVDEHNNDNHPRDAF